MQKLSTQITQRNPMKINTTYLLYLFTYLFLTNTSSPLLATAASCTIDGMVGKQPAEVCEIKNGLKRSINSNRDLGGQTTIFYGPQGTGKKTAAKKIADESGAEFIEVAVESGAKYEEVCTLFNRAEELVRQKKHVVVLIKNVDKISDGQIKLAVHFFLNKSASKAIYILAILTASHPSEYIDPGEKRHMKEVKFNLPNFSERKKYIVNQLRVNNSKKLCNSQINALALTTLNFSYGDLEQLLSSSNELTENNKYLPLTQGYLNQIIQNPELRNRVTVDLLLSSLLIFSFYYFRNDIIYLINKIEGNNPLKKESHEN